MQIDNEKGFGINFIFSYLETDIEKRDIFSRILGTTQRTFGLLIFENLVQREGMTHTGSSEKFQSFKCTIIVLF